MVYQGLRGVCHSLNVFTYTHMSREREERCMTQCNIYASVSDVMRCGEMLLYQAITSGSRWGGEFMPCCLSFDVTCFVLYSDDELETFAVCVMSCLVFWMCYVCYVLCGAMCYVVVCVMWCYVMNGVYQRR